MDMTTEKNILEEMREEDDAATRNFNILKNKNLLKSLGLEKEEVKKKKVTKKKQVENSDTKLKQPRRSTRITKGSSHKIRVPNTNTAINKENNTKKRKRKQSESDSSGGDDSDGDSSGSRGRSHSDSDSDSAITEVKIEDFFDPLKESLRILRREQRKKKGPKSSSSDSSDDLLAKITMGELNPDDNGFTTTKNTQASLTTKQQIYASDEEPEIPLQEVLQFNDYQTDGDNPIVAILHSRAKGGNYDYYVVREDNTREWVSCEKCANCSQLISEFVAKNVAIIRVRRRYYPKQAKGSHT
uniref:Uncharacterized protein n=1 Tax=Arcella intermedia TaxID=1963864 RepID=A0A6B2LA61_9EUKA|eukprot:TRINITY_DN11927_c0_g1_i1.p1 TRINITY_DN11927_c0_g1~~TRINITY_DN11927_c0_g1_i1.p1  ORF type:complete len:324 (+),score=103.32 TRINITY_DN11927_c0_g1_i1:78-974(+)